MGRNEKLGGDTQRRSCRITLLRSEHTSLQKTVQFGRRFGLNQRFFRGISYREPVLHSGGDEVRIFCMVLVLTSLEH